MPLFGKKEKSKLNLEYTATGKKEKDEKAKEVALKKEPSKKDLKGKSKEVTEVEITHAEKGKGKVEIAVEEKKVDAAVKKSRRATTLLGFGSRKDKEKEKDQEKEKEKEEKKSEKNEDGRAVGMERVNSYGSNDGSPKSLDVVFRRLLQAMYIPPELQADIHNTLLHFNSLKHILLFYII